MTDQMIAWEIEEWIRDYKFMLREIKRLNRVLNKVDFIVHYLDNAMEHIEEEKHRIVYDCMMEGMSYTAIANHLDCSRDTIRKIKTAIIGNIVNKVKEANFLQYLNSFKSAV